MTENQDSTLRDPIVPTPKQAIPLRTFVLTGGLFSLLLGLIVIIGWYSENTLLIQVHPLLVPMQYNTALGFLIIGAGLIARLKGNPQTTLMCGSIGIAIGGLTLVEYIANVDLGIDQLFMDHYITVETSHPGRMAPNTALCFLISGLTLLTATHNRIIYKGPSLAILGTIVTGLGTLALVGYISGVEAAYGWSHLTSMAVHTSIGFIILGISFFIYGQIVGNQNQDNMRKWNIIPATLGMLVLTIGLWSGLKNQQNKQLAITTQNEVKYFGRLFEETLTAQIQSLERMAYRWTSRGGTPESEWKVDAEYYIKQLHIYQAIEWIDASYHVRWVVPIEGNEAALNLNLAHEEKRFAALELAKRQSDSTVTQSIDLVQGGKGLLIYVPVSNGSEFDGFILGVVRFDSIIEHIAPFIEKNGFQISIHEGQAKVIGENQEESLMTPFTATQQVTARNATWQIKATMTKAHAANLRNPLPEVVLFAGLLLSILMIVALRISLQATERSHKLEKAFTDLEKVNRELDQFAYVASHDLKAPMRGIRQLTKWIVSDLEGKVDERTSRYLEQMETRVKRLQGLLDALLHYSRVGRQAIDLKPLDTHTLVLGIIEILDTPASMKIEIQGDLPPLTTDRRVFDQVILNLLGNAVSHHDRETGLIVISGERKGDQIALTIKDDGPGINEKFHTKIFEMFQTLRPRDEVESSGMGLAIVKKALAQVGATITVHSNPNEKRGTTFIVLWPRRNRDGK